MKNSRHGRNLGFMDCLAPRPNQQRPGIGFGLKRPLRTIQALGNAMGDWAVDMYVRSAPAHAQERAPAHAQERGRLTRWVLPAVLAVGALALIASAESATAAPIASTA